MTDVTFFKTKLEEQLASVTAELQTIGTYDEASDNWEAIPDEEDLAVDADENTNADSVEAWNERRAALADLENDYRNIKRALAKIEAGTYGVCEISGEHIEEKRLQFKPDARTCMAHMDEESQLPL
jgi:RNA polymerase-binding transcription factor DksA